jgi:hypothetical protein
MRRRALACLGLLLIVAFTMCGGQESSSSGRSRDAGAADVADARTVDASTDAPMEGCGDGRVNCGSYMCGPGWPDTGFWCEPGESCFSLATQGCPPFGCCRRDSRGAPVDCHN